MPEASLPGNVDSRLDADQHARFELPVVSLGDVGGLVAGDAEAVISILSISEVMQGPLRKGYNHIAIEVRDYLVNFPNSRCQEVTLEVLERVGKNDRVGWKGLRTVDSLIIASGILNHVDLFISNDRHFKRSLPREMLLSFEK